MLHAGAYQHPLSETSCEPDDEQCHKIVMLLKPEPWYGMEGAKHEP